MNKTDLVNTVATPAEPTIDDAKKMVEEYLNGFLLPAKEEKVQLVGLVHLKCVTVQHERGGIRKQEKNYKVRILKSQHLSR